MEKLIITGVTNWKDRFYVKFKADDKSMAIIRKMMEELGSESFIEDIPGEVPGYYYDSWKDKLIPIFDTKIKSLLIDIVCDDKFIHMFVNKKPGFKPLNALFDKYCEWAKPKVYRRIK